MIIDIEVGVHHATEIIPLKTYIVLHLETVLLKTKVPLLHIILVHDMTTIREILDLFALHIDLHIDLLMWI